MDPMQAMQMMKLGGTGLGGKPGGTGDMGMRILQAALNQQRPGGMPLATPPAAGEVMPGGSMNITPPAEGALGGLIPAGGLLDKMKAGNMGMLSRLFGGGAGGSPGGVTGGLGGLY